MISFVSSEKLANVPTCSNVEYLLQYRKENFTMKHYKIVYTYFSRGLMEEQEMMFRGLSMTDALACVRQMAYFYCMEDFCVRKVYVKTDDGTAWEEVHD